MIRKGIFLLTLFFGISVLITYALSMIMNPNSLLYWVFLYVFSTSQLFLFLHSLLYWYYTSAKYDVQYNVEKRSADFDKNTLVIISAFNEDNEVLESTFNAVKQSFNGHVMLAVDAPQNVNSYIELCKRHDVICIHRIHRSGFKAGAINNVVLNFLRHQHQYIKKTRRDLADEIVLATNNSSKILPFELPQELKNLDTSLSSVDGLLKSSSRQFSSEYISNLISGEQTKHLRPKNVEILRTKIEDLRKKIDNVVAYYDNSYKQLSTLNKIITPIHLGMEKLSSEIEYLQLETESTLNQLPFMQMIQLVSKTEYCIKTLNVVNSQKFINFSNQKDELFSTILNIGTNLDEVHHDIMLLEKNHLISDINNSVKKDQIKTIYSHLKRLQTNLKTIDTTFILLDKSIKSSYSSYVYENLSQLISGNRTKQLQPKDLESLREMIKTQRSKLGDIDNSIESLYEENLYGNIESMATDNQIKLLPLENLKSLRSKIEELDNDINEFYDLTKSFDVLEYIPDLEKTLAKINRKMFNQEKFLVTNNMKNSLGTIEDLISEFNYTVNDLVAKLPIDVEYIILLDSDAHPKSDLDPQNNFFDLSAKYIQENDLLVFPQFYDKDGGKLVRAAYAQQVPFMKTIMPKRGEDNTAFMLGTNIMVKKNVLESVNGFDDSTVTEDLATTIKIHESKAKSKYINKDVVVNGAPLSIGGYFTQQQRWAYGTYQVFFTMLLRGVGNDLKLKSYIEYLYGNTWYFYGLTFLINALIPFYSIFLEGLIQIPENLFYILYLPYVFSGIIIFIYSVLRTGHGFKDVFYNMSLNAICFFVYIKALVFILAEKKLPFEVTPKSGSSEETILRFKKILPVLVVIGLLGFSLTIYSIRIITGEISLVPGLINIIWSSFFISLLAPVLTFK